LAASGRKNLPPIIVPAPDSCTGTVLELAAEDGCATFSKVVNPRAKDVYSSTIIGKQVIERSTRVGAGMKTILSTSEIIGFLAEAENALEICATAEVNFDEAKSQMEVELDSFVRPVDDHLPEKSVSPCWLPQKQIARETVPRSEALELARDIFHCWVGRVRQSCPMPIHN